MTILGLPVGLLVAWLAYREAARHQQEYGKAPWNISPKTWAVIVFFSGLVIGGILLLVARRADQQAGAAPTGELFSRPPAGPVTAPSGRGRMGSVL